VPAALTAIERYRDEFLGTERANSGKPLRKAMDARPQRQGALEEARRQHNGHLELLAKFCAGARPYEHWEYRFQSSKDFGHELTVSGHAGARKLVAQPSIRVGQPAKRLHADADIRCDFGLRIQLGWGRPERRLMLDAARDAGRADYDG
jgi:hypothetical protein